MKRITLRMGLVVAAAMAAIVLIWPGQQRVTSQTANTSTTTSATMSRTDTAVALTSDTGVASGTFLYVDGELMVAQSEQGTSSRWNVRRGLGQGSTPAVAHTTGSTVWVLASGGAGESFYTFDVASGSACTASEWAYLPRVNTESGQVADCEGGYWMARRNDTIRVRDFTVRDSFDQGYFSMQDDATPVSVTDNEINVVFGSPLGIITYHEEVTKTAESFLSGDSLLDIDGDNDADNEGTEIRIGGWNKTSEGVIVAGTSGGCFAMRVTIGDISGTDQLFIGWVQNEAFSATNVYTGYSDWSVVGLNATDGSIVSLSEVAGGGTLTDDSGVNAADADVRLLKSCISKAGVPSAFYSTNGGSSYVSIPITNGVTAHTAGDQMYPFITFLAAGTDGADVSIDWIELTRFP